MSPSPKPKVIEFGFNHLDIGHPDNPKLWRICGARTRGAEAVHPICTQAAGRGTSHVGAGRCKDHGGNQKIGPENHRYKTGRYAHVFHGRMKEQLSHIQDANENPMDLLPELEVYRVLFAQALESLHQDENGKSVSVEKSIPDKGGRSGGSELEGVEKVHVGPPPPKLLVSAEKMELVDMYGKQIVKTVQTIQAMHNQTALAKAEIVFLMGVMRGRLEKLNPDKKAQKAFWDGVKKDTGLLLESGEEE